MALRTLVLGPPHGLGLASLLPAPEPGTSLGVCVTSSSTSLVGEHTLAYSILS